MIEITALFWYNRPMEKREKEVQELQALLAKKEDENAALRRQVDWLTQQLRLTRGQRFGASSEKTQGILDPIDQISLFNETEAETDGKKPEPELEQVTYQRRKQTAGDGPVWTACGEGRLRIAGERAGLFRMRQAASRLRPRGAAPGVGLCPRAVQGGGVCRVYSVTSNRLGCKQYRRKYGKIGAREKTKTEEKACTYGGGEDVQG